MKKFFSKLALTVSAVVFLAAPAFASGKDDAVAMVKSAVAFYKANGMEKALDAYNDSKGQFVKGELYVAVLAVDGTLLAKGVGQSQIGQNTIDVPDAKGTKFRRLMIEGAIKNGSGWVDYVFVNPKTKELEQKEAYYEKVDDLVINVGFYKGK